MGPCAPGGIVTDADLEPDPPTTVDRCGTCDRCRQACPLGALDRPYVLDRARCLSNLLQSEDLPEDARSAQGNRILDCEICQDACPWNRKHLKRPLDTPLTRRFASELDRWTEVFHLSHLLRMSEADHDAEFGPLGAGVPHRLLRCNVVRAAENAARGRPEGG